MQCDSYNSTVRVPMGRGRSRHALTIVALSLALHGAGSTKALFRRLQSSKHLPPLNFADQPSFVGIATTLSTSAEQNPRQLDSDTIHSVVAPNASVTMTLDFTDGYGTSFECTSVCHFISFSFALAIGLCLILILVVPVSTTNYVKSSSRKRTSKRRLDSAADDLPYQAASHTHPQAIHSRDQRAAGHADMDDSDKNHIDPSDASRYDFIASLSTSPNDAQPLMKAVRTASMVSPRSQRVGAKMATSSPSAIAYATPNYQQLPKVPVPQPPDTSYENLRDEEIQEAEYIEFVRLLGSDGIVMKRIKTKSRGVKIAKWRIRVTPDMMTLLLSKHEGLQVLKKTESVHVKDIVGMTTGTLEAGGAAYMSLLQVDNTSLDFQADNEAMHQKVYHGFGMLLREHDRAKRQYAA
ncbi:hypothetical protein DYB32_004230 [Aphanomyces invadans]|uniref:PH domain-containing protein n=1 Tax=Aphanomyces invadans TaxID=157072 RepID=A0A418AY90_9STRA|nr:hypothetical protein DYB32_004230 [Aphanomyces invadans]